MRRFRVIPVLLVNNSGLYKSKKFKSLQYVGDPINTVKIFNDKEVDEICILDISATPGEKSPNFDLINSVTSEAFMPLSYGGGITSLEQVDIIFRNGVEKVVINSEFARNPTLVTEIAKKYGSQSVVVSIDYKKNIFGKKTVYTQCGKNKTNYVPKDYAKMAEDFGAGEVLLNSIERDGMYQGYDLETLNIVSNDINIPVIICGGASSIKDFSDAIKSGASAVSAGSMFVFQRPHQAVLINYPKYVDISNLIK
jgi:imidazole glycerol-phosphate synthase subunit HisF